MRSVRTRALTGGPAGMLSAGVLVKITVLFKNNHSQMIIKLQHLYSIYLKLMIQQCILADLFLKLVQHNDILLTAIDFS